MVKTDCSSLFTGAGSYKKSSIAVLAGGRSAVATIANQLNQFEMSSNISGQAYRPKVVSLIFFCESTRALLKAQKATLTKLNVRKSDFSVGLVLQKGALESGN
jgi:hypothetical protein